MSHIWLIDKLVSVIGGSGISTVAIMLNGHFLKYNGRRIYLMCKPTESTERLCYFTRQYSEEANGEKKTNVEELSYVWTNNIYNELTSSSLFGVDVGVEQKLENTKITINAEHEFVCIESELYQAAVKASDLSGRVSIAINGVEILPDTVSILLRVFLNQSLLNYREVVYGNGADGFIRRLIRRNRFYGIRPESFVPVFVEVEGVYNPLNNLKLQAKNTAMFKVAEEKGRFVQAHDVSAYFLTHKEICQAFGMEHFVRFKSSVWFDIFIGILQPTNVEFPNSYRTVLCWTGNLKRPSGLKRVYGEEEFVETVNKFKDEYHDELNNYTKHNSLEDYILKEYAMIRHIGPTFLDVGITPAKLCSYYNEVKLL